MISNLGNFFLSAILFFWFLQGSVLDDEYNPSLGAAPPGVLMDRLSPTSSITSSQHDHSPVYGTPGTAKGILV